MRQDKDKLNDILSAIESIERYLTQSKDAFDADELVQVWMLHYLQVIGEAARSTSTVLRESYASVPWDAIIGFRNLVVHEYFRIDLDVVWGIVTDDLPILKRQIEEILITLK